MRFPRNNNPYPVLALSATVDPSVQQRIGENLAIKFDAVVKGDVYRPNLHLRFAYQETPLDEDTAQLCTLVREHFSKATASKGVLLVYVRERVCL